MPTHKRATTANAESGVDSPGAIYGVDIGLANTARITADQQMRGSGKAGAHAKSGVAPKQAAGRKTKMGSRRAQVSAHVNDFR